MNSMFKNMSSLRELDMSNWDFTHYTSFSEGGGMFYIMNGEGILTGLEKLNLENARLPINSNDLFYGISNIKYLNLKNVDTSETTNMRYMFKNVPSVKEIDLSNFDVSNVLPGYLWGMFDGLYSLEKLDISSFDLSVYENSSSAIGLNNVSANEIVTPKNLSIGNNYISLGKAMYAKGDSVGITTITKDTPTQTVYKDHIWD